jgi:hypothetical protein
VATGDKVQLNRVEMVNDFQLWLDQEVWNGGDERVGRREVIYDFTDSARIFMKSIGYVMDSAWNSRVVARWMYTIQCDIIVRKRRYDTIAYPEPLHRNWPEDLREFQHIMDFDTISSFMEEWKSYSDFEEGTHIGQRMFCDLPNILYPFINMDKSYNGRVVEDALYDSDTDSDESWRGSKRRGTDAYIADMNEGFHR